MDPKTAALYNDGILHTARGFYGIPADSIHLLDGFESFIYEFERPDGRFILRIGHSSRRSPDLIAGEVDWINFLAAGGAGVARAVLSQNGNLVEPVADGQGGQFLCTAFVRAPGGEVKKEQVNERLFFNYGKLMGRMHALAKTYTLPNPAWKRSEWNDPEMLYADRWLDSGDEKILAPYGELKEHLFRLPEDPDSYGMIHQDAHPGNFFVDEDYRITLFDFDDCAYGHFIYDIAMVLFYSSMWDRQDPSAFTQRFMPVFLDGYRGENRLVPAWLKELPHFLKLREIDLFAQIQFTFPEESYMENPWMAHYMSGRRQCIEKCQPFIDFDWDSLADFL